jgi:ribosomal-protein-alanine N-acetyltransferase
VTPFFILSAAAAELDLLAALHESAFVEPWSASSLGELLRFPTAFALIAASPADSNGGLIPAPRGFILCRIAGGECEVLTLAVRPEARRQGIATALLKAAMERARAGGSEAAFLEVAEDNEGARRLYARLGFWLVGRRPGYYHGAAGKATDALVLRYAG